MDNEAQIEWLLDNYEKAEGLERERLQILLVASGPRKPETIRAILRLGAIIAGRDTASNAEGISLLHNAIKLAYDDSAGNNELEGEAMWRLITAKGTEEAF